jgi:hypothetical protein
VVIGQRFGVLLNEWDATGGLDLSAPAVSGDNRVLAQGAMIGKITSMGLFKPLAIETILDPKAQPFLHDHQIDGTPVLPGVMGIEAFAEAALCLLPSWHVEAVEDVNFLAPFKFYRNEPRTVTIETTIHPHQNALLADCRLIGHRDLPGQKGPQVTEHFTGRVRLAKQAGKAGNLLAPGRPPGNIVEAADIYRLYFHGPAYQVMERAWWDGKRIVGLMSERLGDSHHPANLPTLMAPRLIELCFQTAGVWELGTQGRMGLPQHIDRVSLLRAPDLAEGRLYAVVTPDPGQGTFHAEVVDSAGNQYVDLRGYRTVTLSNVAEAEALKPLQAAMSLQSVAA